MRSKIEALFLDIGGVLGTNGWDRPLRVDAAKKFGLDFAEMDERHHLTFDTYEEGKLTLDEYLSRIVFYEKRKFSRDEFKKFMFSCSKPYLDSIQFFRALKSKYKLRVVAVSNEGKELNAHRVAQFKLHSLIDFFIMSSSVHLRKPDIDMFRLAMESTLLAPEDIIFIDDRAMFVEVAMTLGIQGIHHTSLENTQKKLSESGLTLFEPKIYREASL